MRKRILAAALSLCLVLSLLPTVAFAADASDSSDSEDTLATSGTCGATESDQVEWSFNSDTGVLTISGTGAIMDDPANKKNWADVVSEISEVRIEEGITSLGGNLIRNMSDATVYVPKTVTEIKHSNEQAAFNNGFDVHIVLDPENESYVMENGVLFTTDKKTLVKYTMDAPADYTVPDGVETIAAKGMALVSKLESVVLPESVTTLENYAFQGSSNLLEFTFPDTVTTIGSYLFLGSGLERLTLGHGLTTVHNSAFEKARELEYVFISNTVTELQSRAFMDTALTKVEFEDNSELETIGNTVFSGCTKLENIQLPESVREIGENAFNGCSKLSEIRLNEGLTKIGSYAFRSCDALLDIEIPSTITNVDQIGSQLKGFYSATVYANVLNTAATWHGILELQHNGSDADKAGWYDAEGTFYRTGTAANREEITKKTKVYAVYSTGTAFDANDGEGSIDAMTSYYAPGLSDDATITLANKTCKLPENTFTKEGYIFIGWNTKADGTGASYTDQETLTAGKDAVEKLYAQWGVKIVEDTYFVYPVIEDQTYTGSELKPAVKVTKNGEEITEGFTVEYTNNTDVGTATATVKVDGTVIGTATFQIVKAKVIVAQVGTQGYETLTDAIAAAQSGATVKLLGDVTEDITVSAGQKLTLDLNGHKITNASGHTITVESGAALTITGEGTVDNITHAKAAIVNYGTVTLNGGTYTRSKEDEANNKDSAGKNSYYTILNDKGGNMTINSGVTVTNAGHFSSMIRNGGDEKSTTKSVLTINGGTFSGGLNTVKNDELGELTITGGNFSNTSQYVIMNWNEATISGGSFATNDTAEAVLFSVAYNDRAAGKLTITGGSFKGSASQAMITNTYGAAYTGTASVSGGMFSGTVDEKFLAKGFEAKLVNGVYQVQQEKLDNPNEYELILTPDKRHVSAGDEINYTVTLKHTKGDSAEFGFLRITPEVNNELLEFAKFEKSENSAGVNFNSKTGFWFISSGEKGCALAEDETLTLGTLTYKVKGYETDQTSVEVTVNGKTNVEDEDGCDQITNPGYNEGAKVTVNANDVTYHVIKVTFKQDDNTANDKLFYAPYDNTGLYASLKDLENRTNKQDAPELDMDSTGGTAYRLKDADWHLGTPEGEAYTDTKTFTENATYVTNRVELVKITTPDNGVVEVPTTDKQVVTERDGGTYVDKNNNLTFTVADDKTPGEKYEVTVTVNGEPVTPKQNDDGSYTVKGEDVTGEVKITVKSVLDLDENDIYIFTDGKEGTEAYAYLPYSTYSGNDTLVLIKGKTNANYTLDAGQPTIYRTDAYKAAVGEDYTHAVLVPGQEIVSKKAMLDYLTSVGLKVTDQDNEEINIASWDTNGNNNEKRDLGDVQAANDFKTLKELKWTPSDKLLLLADVVTLPKNSTDADKYNDAAYTQKRDGHVSDDDVSAFVYRYAKLG